MSSPPLAALHINPPPDPTEGIQRMIALRSMLMNQQREQALLPGQIQQQQQQLQAGALDVQQKQQAIKDQQGLLALYQKHNGDLDKVLQEAPTAGISPQAIQQVQLHNIDVKTKTADLVAKQGTEAARQADLMLGAHDAVDKSPADQKPIMYQQQLASLQRQGVDTSQLPPQYPGDDQFKLLGIVAQGHAKNVENALKAAQTQEAAGRASESQAQTAKINAEINPNNPADKDIAQQKYQDILQRLQSGGMNAITTAEYQWAKAHELSERKSTTQSDTLGVTQTSTSGPSGLAAVGARGAMAPSGSPTPGQASKPGAPAPSVPLGNPYHANPKDSIVDMVGNYKMNPMMLSRLLTKHPDLIGLVGTKYPDWNQAEYNARNAMVTKYTSGSQSKEINAINTAMGHVKELDDSIDQLNNGSLTGLNYIANKLGVATGNDALTVFKTIVHRVGPEIASAYVPGGGGQAERFADEKDFSENLAPNQLHANAAVTVKLLRSKVGALENQWQNTMQRDDFQKRFISPAAQSAFDKFATKGTGALQVGQQVTLKNGKTVKVTAVHPDGSFDAN